jgi:predicted DNA-binding transcriptional regulator AlpA
MSEPAISAPQTPVFIPLEEVAGLIGVCTATVRRWARTHPDFPKPFLLTERVWRWDREEILAWVAARRWLHALDAGERAAPTKPDMQEA